MSRAVGYRWHLRRVMAEHNMFATSDLVPRLAERGVALSREQVYRLVTGVPQRLSLHVLAALCDIFDCAPGDLVEPDRGGSGRGTRTSTARRANTTETTATGTTAPGTTATGTTATGTPPRPRRARVAAAPAGPG